MDRNWIDSVALEQTGEVVIAFERGGKIAYANRTAREKLGYADDKIMQCNMADIFRMEFQQGNGDLEPFDIQKLRENEETVMYRENSSCFPASVRVFSSEDGDTNFLIAEDMTWRKSMDVRIRQLKEEEEENRKMRNEFTANVTHELRTPVNGIKGHVLALLEDITDDEQKKTLGIILYCCDNMAAIINNILDFSKMEAGKFILDEGEFDFYKLMDRVIATHMAEINKKELHVSVYIDENIPQLVIGDELRIGQILNNILSNAVKFTLVGQISVDVSRTMQVNDEVELFFMVRDTGIGISVEEQDKLFQSFKQADASITRRFGGTGLGLSVTKQLVEMMNGTIFVESEKGKGSCFSFNIRLHTSQDAGESNDMSEAYQKWSNLTVGMEQEEVHDNFFEFGSEDNRAELKKRMDKLVLSIELGAWDKAESTAEVIKALTEGAGSGVKRPMLRLEMAIRKENYDKSMAAYELLKTTVEQLYENGV